MEHFNSPRSGVALGSLPNQTSRAAVPDTGLGGVYNTLDNLQSELVHVIARIDGAVVRLAGSVLSDAQTNSQIAPVPAGSIGALNAKLDEVSRDVSRLRALADRLDAAI